MKNRLHIILLSLLISMSCIAQAGDIQVPKGILTLDGALAKDFTLADIDGKQHRFTTQSDKWRFVHFWASWCGPCRREMPLIQSLASSMRQRPLEIIMINTAENEDTIFSFMGLVAPELNSLMDRNGEITELWQPRGLPTTILVDPQGRKRYMAIGGREWNSQPYLDFLTGLMQPVKP